MSPELGFGRIVVSDDAPVVVIAEAACEHLGDVGVARRMVDVAAAAGVDVIKFQHHVPEEMIPGSIQFWGGSMDDVLERWNLSLEEHVDLMAQCEAAGIQYLCTPFSAAAARQLDAIGVPAFKTGSGELTNLPMQREIAAMGKPMIVSTGMATLEEIDRTVEALRAAEATFMLTNCTSAYPPRYDQLNLRLIPALRERYGVLVGHSDHTPEGVSALAAVALGARVVEKHFTLDRKHGGPDRDVSLEPPALRDLVSSIRKVEAALGSAEKRIYAEEEVVRSWAHHSVATVRDIVAGRPIEAADVAVKRPGSGIPARFLDDVVGRVAGRDIGRDTPLQWADLEPAGPAS
jgi:N,N'-diacetyllegionaminate synthase